jgi:sterol desaturase/sphingolipid hydroxylase (fatty acid hydroxylase superfamily)
MLNVMHGRHVLAALVMLHAVEMVGIFGAAVGAAGLARANPGRGMGLAALSLLLAAVTVGWQGYRVLAGRRSLNVAGLAVQSGIVMVAIAVATQNLAVGAIGIAMGCIVLAGWGRLAKTDLATTDPVSAAPSRQPVAVAAAGPATQIGFSGAWLAVLTAIVVLAALSVRTNIVFALAILAVIFIPLERLFALHPRRVLRRGWRTDVVHYLVNGAALKVGLVVSVIAVGSVLRAFVPAPLRLGIAASPTWVQIVAGFAITTVGGYAGHRAAHEVPLLWRFHRVHHSIREIDWLAANHLHPLDETFGRSAAVLPLYALGFGRVSLGAFVILITVQAIFIHANVRISWGPLRWVIATPQFHHWHHAREPEAFNSNFAGEFPVLDALFGTLYLPAGRWPEEYGIDDVEPTGYLRQLAWPLRTRCAADSDAECPKLVGQSTIAPSAASSRQSGGIF